MEEKEKNEVKYEIFYQDKVYKAPFEYNTPVTHELDQLQDKDLTLADLHEITLWKIDRYPQISQEILDELNKLHKSDNFDEQATRNILGAMLRAHGISLAMASTYLRFTNPKVFPIIDTRALRAAFDYKVVAEKEKILLSYRNSDSIYSRQIDLYIDYVAKLNEIAKNGYHGLFIKFEDLDRFLYEIDSEAGFKLEDKEPFDPNKFEKWKELIENWKVKIKNEGVETK